jgi:cullin 1
VTLDLNPKGVSSPCYEVYQTYFESPFIHATETYCKEWSKDLLASNSPEQVVEYVKKVEAFLDREIERVPLYLHDSTMTGLTAVCYENLVRQHSDTLRGALPELRSNDWETDADLVEKVIEDSEIDKQGDKLWY